MAERTSYMRMILDESRVTLQSATHSLTTVLALLIDPIKKIHRGLRPMPTRNVSDDLSRDALGFMGFTMRKLALNMSTNCV